MKKEKHIIRNTLVVLGSIAVTSVTIFASDKIDFLKDAYVGSVATSIASKCSEGMTFVSGSNGDFCIDTFEVSPGKACHFSNPVSSLETLQNLEHPSCIPVSEKDALPWTNITHAQAIEACSKAYKHLPSNEEWYIASLGTSDQVQASGCNIDRNWDGQSIGKTGTGLNCKSNWGSYDMIGNVWEWTFETVHEGVYEGRELPDAGYVASVAEDGIPVTTAEEPNPLYYNDRFWIDKNAHTAIFRGGFWNSGQEAGRFSVHSGIPLTFSGEAVGFRCVTRL